MATLTFSATMSYKNDFCVEANETLVEYFGEIFPSSFVQTLAHMGSRIFR